MVPNIVNNSRYPTKMTKGYLYLRPDYLTSELTYKRYEITYKV